MEKEKVIVIVGPTASGKTKTSIAVAKAFGGEVISGDSMQVYRGMDIGTAKITEEEMEGVPHHLLDIKDPDEPFSTAEFQRLVREKISDITARGKVPVIAGGTGLYIQSVLYDYQFSPAAGDPEFRAEMEKRAEEGGGDELYEELRKIDPQSAAAIHPNNIRRVIRALEVYHLTGKTMSGEREKQSPEPLYNAALVGLSMDRAELYDRINRRVDEMIRTGLVDEARRFYDQGLRGVQSVQAIGYKEWFAYFDGRLKFEEAAEELKKNTRHYAKRQLTWFRNKMDIAWFEFGRDREQWSKVEEIIDYIAGKLRL